MNRRQVMAAFGTSAVVIGSPAVSQTGDNDGVESFTSGGREIAVEWFGGRPEGGGPRPALLLLHGADGLSSPGRYAPAARALAVAGYHVAFIHYLDSTGERRVDYGRLPVGYPVWLRTVRDAIDWVGAKPQVLRGGVGLVGISLGAALSFSAAGQDRRVRAIVDYAGPLPRDVAAARPTLPPTLVLHGDADRIVPVSNAHDIEALLKERAVPHEVVIYPGQGHVLTGTARLDAAIRTASFLSQHL